MTAKGQSGKVVLDSITANAAWIDALLGLFWEVDIGVKLGMTFPRSTLRAYEAAEAARKAL